MPLAQVHRVEVRAGESLAIDWYPAGPGAQAALFVHGLGSHRRGDKAVHFAERFNDKGWAFAAFDMRGHGESDGTVRDLTMSGMLSDLTAAVRWVGENGDASKIVLIGSSMGAAVAAWYALAQAGDIGPLVLIAPALRFPASLVAGLSPDLLARWRETGLYRFRSAWIDLEIGYQLLEDGAGYDPDLLLRSHAARTLIFHGMQDDTVDWNDSVAFARRSPGAVDLIVLRDGDHRLTDHRQLMFELLWSWLTRQQHISTAKVHV